MTPCVEQAYDRMFGTDFQNFFIKNMNYTFTRFQGLSQVEKTTGCIQPCETYEYYTKNILKYQVENHHGDSAADILQKTGLNTSSFLSINYFPPQQYQIDEEIVAYTGIKLISEVGGILGIFVGVSFWSLYEIVLMPIIVRLEKIVMEIINSKK